MALARSGRTVWSVHVTSLAANQTPESYASALSSRGFDLEERIGRGAFGTVYKANQRSLGRPVAVKFFDSPFMQQPINRKRFEREALLLARIQHPSVPYVITQGTLKDESNTPYSVMHFIPGEGLDRVVQRDGRFQANRAVDVMLDVLDALETVHERGIVHRDVKPNNIMIEKARTWLIDFSIGIAIAAIPGLSRPTATGS